MKILRLIIYLHFFIFFYLPLFSAEFKGEFLQGSFILGKTEPNSKIEVDGRKIRVDKNGYFAFGLGRDRKNDVVIKIKEKGKLKTIQKKYLKENTKFKK